MTARVWQGGGVEAYVGVLECHLCVCGWACGCVCVCARARVCVRACASARACVRACVYVCIGLWSFAHACEPARVPDGISCQSLMQVTCL